MNDPTQKSELVVIMSDEVLEEMEKDPACAEFVRELSAKFRQAHYGVETGQYDSFEQAMEALTGQKPEFTPFDDDDDSDDADARTVSVNFLKIEPIKKS